MRLAVLPLIAALLTGCGADTPAVSEADKEPGMFGKPPKKSYVIASPMEGTLMKDGKPLAHAKIIRSLSWNVNDREVVQEFVTDEQGRFSLPVHEEQFSIGRFTQFACSTFLDVEVEGERFEFWYNNKFDGEIYGETGGRHLDELVCDLSNEELRFRPGNALTTVCRWTDMPEESEF